LLSLKLISSAIPGRDCQIHTSYLTYEAHLYNIIRQAEWDKGFEYEGVVCLHLSDILKFPEAKIEVTNPAIDWPVNRKFLSRDV